MASNNLNTNSMIPNQQFSTQKKVSRLLLLFYTLMPLISVSAVNFSELIKTKTPEGLMKEIAKREREIDINKNFETIFHAYLYISTPVSTSNLKSSDPNKANLAVKDRSDTLYYNGDTTNSQLWNDISPEILTKCIEYMPKKNVDKYLLNDLYRYWMRRWIEKWVNKDHQEGNLSDDKYTTLIGQNKDNTDDSKKAYKKMEEEFRMKLNKVIEAYKNLKEKWEYEKTQRLFSTYMINFSLKGASYDQGKIIKNSNSQYSNKDKENFVKYYYKYLRTLKNKSNENANNYKTISQLFKSNTFTYPTAKKKITEIDSIVNKKVNFYLNFVNNEFSRIKTLFPNLSGRSLLNLTKMPFLTDNKGGYSAGLLRNVYLSIKSIIPKKNETFLLSDTSLILSNLLNKSIRLQDTLNRLNSDKAKVIMKYIISYDNQYKNLKKELSSLIGQNTFPSSESSLQKSVVTPLKKIIKEQYEKINQQKIKINKLKQGKENQNSNINYNTINTNLGQLILHQKLKDANFLGENSIKVIKAEEEQSKTITKNVISIIQHQPLANEEFLPKEKVTLIFKAQQEKETEIHNIIQKVIKTGKIEDKHKKSFHIIPEEGLQDILTSQNQTKELIRIIKEAKDSTSLILNKKVLDVVNQLKKKSGFNLLEETNNTIKEDTIKVINNGSPNSDTFLGNEESSKVINTMKLIIQAIAQDATKIVNGDNYSENFLRDQTKSIETAIQEKSDKTRDTIINLIETPQLTKTNLPKNFISSFNKVIDEKNNEISKSIVEVLSKLLKLPKKEKLEKTSIQLLKKYKFDTLTQPIQKLKVASSSRTDSEKIAEKLKEKEQRIQQISQKIIIDKESLTKTNNQIESAVKIFKEKEKELIKVQKNITKTKKDQLKKIQKKVSKSWMFLGIILLVTFTLEAIVGCIYTVRTGGKKNFLSWIKEEIRSLFVTDKME